MRLVCLDGSWDAITAMVSQKTEILVHAFIDAYRRADEELLYSMIHDDIDWAVYGPEVYLLFSGELHGKSAVARTLEEVANLYTLAKCDIVLRIIHGDRAALVLQIACEQRSTKRVITFRGAMFLQFRQNLLAEFRMFMDTFDLVEQVHGTWIDIPVSHTAGWKRNGEEA
jgi:SnoaL-like domain